MVLVQVRERHQLTTDTAIFLLAATGLGDDLDPLKSPNTASHALPSCSPLLGKLDANSSCASRSWRRLPRCIFRGIESPRRMVLQTPRDAAASGVRGRRGANVIAWRDIGWPLKFLGLMVPVGAACPLLAAEHLNPAGDLGCL